MAKKIANDIAKKELNDIAKKEASDITNKEVNGIAEEEANVKKSRLLTWSFVILWQGQFVSTLGDILYEIALGFWVLVKTGSTALMGALMASYVLPKVIISPVAGVIVDRVSRKKLMMVMDTLRGISIVAIGVAAINGFIQIWMVFVGSVILGVCGAFFFPAVNASIPNIVPKSQLVRANSAFSMITASSNIIGNSAGGLLYQMIGAPFFFLFNGLSYLFSGLSVIFVKMKDIRKKEEEKPHFWEDMKEGFVFIWKFRGLRNLVAVASLLNFFISVALVLIIPLFHRTKGLDAGKYGITMAFVTGGMLLGMLFTTVVPISPKRKLNWFMLSAVVSSLCYAVFPLLRIFPVMLALVLIGGFFISITNVFLNASIQMTVPQNMMGKVFALMGTVAQGLMPVSMVLGGIMAEFVPIKYIISACFIGSLLVMAPFAFIPSFKRFIRFDPEKETLEDIM